MPRRKTLEAARPRKRSRISDTKRGMIVSRRLNEPPPIQTTQKKRIKIRFTSGATALGTTSSSATPVQLGELLDIIYVATTANAALQQARVCNAIRLKKIELWAPPTGGASTSNCGLELSGTTAGYSGNSIKVSDSTMGTANPAYCSISVPRSHAVLGNWVNSVGTGGQALGTAFTAWSTGGGWVLDVTMDVAFIDTANGNTAPQNTYGGQAGSTNFVSTPTIGYVYYASLGRGNATSVFVPANLPTT